ncbi:MAG TPA: hypothetical protein VJR89_23205 [Polyangiales bacterium]|nr:hypothetical protein [Polyangiales bacterium]
MIARTLGWAAAIGLQLLCAAALRAQPASDPRSSELDAGALLAQAEEAMTELDYGRTRDLANAALVRGKLDTAGLIRAYRLIAVACAQLGDEPAAEQAFIRLFALEPDSTISTRLAPERRSAVLNARGFWSVRRDAFGVDVSYARRERQIEVHLRDPLAWGAIVHVYYRFGDRSYVRAQKLAAPDLLFDVQEIGLTEPLEVYAYVVDAHDNVVLEFGRERDPHLFGLSDAELEEYLRRDIRGGQPGSYALRLEELGVDVGVHGYLSLEFKPVMDTPSFDLHHATIMVRAEFQRAVSLEIALEWEHLALELGDFYLPHAFMDLQASEWLILRAGWFEVPVGAFNEYLYPDFLRITGQAPLFARSVVPGLWSEVGLQLRGRFVLSKLTNLTYAVFLVNGLEQPDEMPGDGDVAEGGDIRAMRFHANDSFSGDKALGGRVGLEVGEFDVGVSGYTGNYTIDADRRLSIGDVDASYRGELLTVRTEAALAWQETTREVLHKFGMYTLVALRPIPYLEPYAEYDYVDVDGIVHGVLVGIAIYPHPNERSTRNLRLKSECGYQFPEHADKEFVWFFQLTTGF